VARREGIGPHPSIAPRLAVIDRRLSQAMAHRHHHLLLRRHLLQMSARPRVSVLHVEAILAAVIPAVAEISKRLSHLGEFLLSHSALPVNLSTKKGF
jgi:hypothetical protein